jgi:RND family efflux transporter MFP subunit
LEMKRFLPIVTLLGIAAVAIVLWKFIPALSDKISPLLTGQDPIAVRAVQVRRGSVAVEIRGSGQLAPVKQVDIVSPVPGVLEEIRYKVGDSVAAGQLIASVRPTELLERLRQTEASLKAARADVGKSESRLKDTEKELERTRELRNRDLIAGQDLKAAEAAAATTRAETDLARAQEAQQQATVEQLRYIVSFSKIAAPFAGVVSRRQKTAGSRVQRSEPILTLASLDLMRVTIGISDKDLNLIQRDTPGQIIVEDFPGRTFEGNVVGVRSAAADSKTEAEIHVKNSEHLLTGGMVAFVSLSTAEKRSALLIPKQALFKAGEKSYVDVVANRRIQRRVITVGENQKSMIELTSGVREGEWVVAASARPLKANSKVRIITEKTTPVR